jgi:hypothetical protein
LFHTYVEIETASVQEPCHIILVAKPDGKRPQGRPRSRWVDNIRMGLGEIEWDGKD